MFEYTSRNKSDIRDSYTTEIRTCNYGYKDRTRFADSLEKRTENDLDKSIFLPNVTSRLKKKCDPRVSLDGPMAISFEKYVHNIFRPGITLPKLSTTFSNSINAHSMLRIHDLLGPAALNESFDKDIMKTPLEEMFDELGLTGNYPTHSANSIALPYQKSNCTSYQRKANDDWKRNNKQMIIDYKGSDTTPLTPYMYAEYPYVRSQDSRIVGSNFVQITSRPKDSFLEKIDRTLSNVRAMPRF